MTVIHSNSFRIVIKYHFIQYHQKFFRCGSLKELLNLSYHSEDSIVTLDIDRHNVRGVPSHIRCHTNEVSLM